MDNSITIDQYRGRANGANGLTVIKADAILRVKMDNSIDFWGPLSRFWAILGVSKVAKVPRFQGFTCKCPKRDNGKFNDFKHFTTFAKIVKRGVSEVAKVQLFQGVKFATSQVYFTHPWKNRVKVKEFRPFR